MALRTSNIVMAFAAATLLAGCASPAMHGHRMMNTQKQDAMEHCGGMDHGKMKPDAKDSHDGHGRMKGAMKGCDGMAKGSPAAGSDAHADHHP